MSRTNKPMDQESLQEEYEEIKLKLLMARFAELEGKTLLEESLELSKDPFYLPTEEAKQTFVRRLNRYFTQMYLKKAARRLVPMGYKKVAVVLSLFIVILLTSFLSVEAVRVKVLNMFIQVEREYTEIRLGQDSQRYEDSHIQIDWDNAYVPSKIPKGFRITKVTNNETLKSIKYENENKDYILFQQNNEHSSANADTEESDEVTHTTIQGEDGLVIRKKDLITIVWQNKTRLFLIMGKSTSVSKEELIQMAESVKLP